MDPSRRALVIAALAATSAATSASDGQEQTAAGQRVGAADSPEAGKASSGALEFATWTSAIAAHIRSHIGIVRLLGYYAPSDGGGALYRRAPSAPEHMLWFRSADGAYWVWSDTHLSVLMAGARGDGKYDAATGLILGGTDDTQAIQNAISAHCYFGLADTCYFPNRTFRTTSPLHAHYGTSSEQCRLIGQWNYRGSNPSRTYRDAPSGTTILCDFTVGMGINIAGSYGAHIKGLALIGRNGPWIFANDLGYGRPPLRDDTVEANWIDPALPASASHRFSPYAGITVDAFYEKGTHDYPAINFPGFLRTKSVSKVSSEVLIEDCYIGGFVVGVADAPGGAPASCDFLKLRRVVFERNQYGLSEGQSQQRNLFRDSCCYFRCYCAETSNTHGAQSGSMGPAINTSYAGVINLFKFFSSGGANPYYNGIPLIFLGCYGETLWRLGDIAADTPVETAVVFDGCSFAFDAFSTPSRGVPATIMAGFTPGSPVRITFRDTRLYAYASVCPIMFDSECVTADGLCLLSNNGIGIAGNNYVGSAFRARPYQRFASNATADGLILFDGTSRTGRMRLKFAQYDVDAGAPNAHNVKNVICGPSQLSDRSHPACAYMQRLVGSSEADGEGTWLPQLTNPLNKRALADARLDGRRLSFLLPQDWRELTSLAYRGPLPGDVMIDQATGSVFFVRSQVLATGAVIAELQNNYFAEGGGGIFRSRVEIDISSGNFVVINARLYTSRSFLQGSIEIGSPYVTILGSADHERTFDESEIAVADYVYVDEKRDMVFPRTSSRIVSAQATRIELAGRASHSQSRKLLRIFIRAGAANS